MRVGLNTSVIPKQDATKMYDKVVVEAIKKLVKEKWENEKSGHDWWHIKRVFNLAKYIARQENADNYMVELSALLHEMTDWKFHKDNSEKGKNQAIKWLQYQQVPQQYINNILSIINSISFKGARVEDRPLQLEGQILQDADRLDAMGAIGIARAFTFGGYHNQDIHVPNSTLHFHESFDEYKNKETTTINHFYEKLLLLKERMHTQTGREIAEKRHQFMEDYLKQFFEEWHFNDT